MLKLLALLITTLSFAAASDYFKFDVQKKVLPNGLTILVHEKRDVPIISYHSWFKIGSKNEEKGKSGLAHFFEHLMFSGTEKYPDDKFDSIMELKGITYNAYTTQDNTVYFELLPTQELEFVIDMEADRLKNLKISKKEFEKERKVILEERLKRLEDSTEGLMSANLYDSLFINLPYKVPVIGLKVDLEKLTLNDANAFFKKYYQPSSLVISVVGDVDSQEVFKLIEKYYGNIESHPERQKTIFNTDSNLNQDIRHEIKRDVEIEKILIGYKIGKLGEKESYALDLIAQILAGDKSSRLYKKLVLQKNLAQQVFAYAYNLQEAGSFEITVSLRDKASKEEVLAIINDEMKSLYEKPVLDSELKRAQLYTVKDTIESLRSSQSRSRLLGLNEAILGDYNRLFSDTAIYQGLTSKDLLMAAKNRFFNKHRVILELNKK